MTVQARTLLSPVPHDIPPSAITESAARDQDVLVLLRIFQSVDCTSTAVDAAHDVNLRNGFFKLAALHTTSKNGRDVRCTRVGVSPKGVGYNEIAIPTTVCFMPLVRGDKRTVGSQAEQGWNREEVGGENWCVVQDVFVDQESGNWGSLEPCQPLFLE